MIGLGTFHLIIGAAAAIFSPDTAALAPAPAAPVGLETHWAPIRDSDFVARLLAPADTPRVRRPRVVEVSDWYSRRLTIHRWVAIATLPVFAVQYYAGNKLLNEGAQAPSWVRPTHRLGARVLAGMFVVNTTTGLWNWWDSRTVRQGRVLRTIHGLAMLTADAGFTWAGVKLSQDAKTSFSARQEHHRVALACIGITVASEAAMKFWNR